jgi:hypothetical protein
MDESVEVSHDVAVKIADSLSSKLTTDFLNSINVIVTIILEQLLSQQLSLLVKIIDKNIIHELSYSLFFLLNHIIQGHFHPHEHSIDITSFFLNTQILLSIKEEILLFEFLPKFLTPLSQYSQDSRTLDRQMTFLDLAVSVSRYILRYFPTYDIAGIFLDLLSIFLIMI